MPNLPVRRDFGELDFSEDHRLDPVFAADRTSRPASRLFGPSREGTGLLLESCQLPPKLHRFPAGPAGADATDRDQRAVLVNTEQQAPDLVAIVGSVREPADHELLALLAP
jgi:hypothetical protein